MRSDNKNGPAESVAQRQDEIFDVVDENDVVVSQATRRDVHARKLLHRAVHALAFDPAGRVFLQKRSMLKDSSPGCWDSSCSGHLDSGEGYDAAVVRELHEEIGVSVGPANALERLFRLSPGVETGWEFVWVYRLRSEGPFVLHPAEIERGEWFTTEEIARGIETRPREFTRAFKHLWPRVLAAGAGGGR